MTLPEINIEAYGPALVAMVAKTSWLPHPETVRALPGAVFPTVRARKGCKRCGEVMRDGVAEGMYDDNMTPRWGLLWAHGITITHHPSDRTFAHVWEGADDIASYTHLANLVMVPEPFAGLTDKKGPLTGYLRWHAWSVYGWKPKAAPEPVKPDGFDEIAWQYLPKIDDPMACIRERVRELENERIRVLRPIMERLGMI